MALSRPRSRARKTRSSGMVGGVNSGWPGREWWMVTRGWRMVNAAWWKVDRCGRPDLPAWIGNARTARFENHVRPGRLHDANALRVSHSLRQEVHMEHVGSQSAPGVTRFVVLRACYPFLRRAKRLRAALGRSLYLIPQPVGTPGLNARFQGTSNVVRLRVVLRIRPH